MLQVYAAHQRRDEGQAGILLTERVVDFGNDFGRLASLLGQQPEQCDGGRHDDGSRDALSGHVANDEIEFLLFSFFSCNQLIVVEVAAHLVHRFQRGIQVSACLREVVAQDAHLYGVGNVQLFLHHALLVGQLDQAALVPDRAQDDDGQQDEADDRHQQHSVEHGGDVPVDILFLTGQRQEHDVGAVSALHGPADNQVVVLVLQTVNRGACYEHSLGRLQHAHRVGVGLCFFQQVLHPVERDVHVECADGAAVAVVDGHHVRNDERASVHAVGIGVAPVAVLPLQSVAVPFFR